MAAGIVALSSGALPSGVAIIRMSGGDAMLDLAVKIAGALPVARTLALRPLRNPVSGDVLDHGLIAVFPAPASFTGEHCVELHVHGSRAVVAALLDGIVRSGQCRLADAGEFSRRAFENGKLDLVQIEGLGDLLQAETESQRKLALVRMTGRLSEKIAKWRGLLLNALAEIEARLDFADEDDVPDDLPDTFWSSLDVLSAEIERAMETLASGAVIREGYRVALYGAPNVGKSSLLNALAGSDIAIVTSEAGTTRDTKDVSIDLGGMKVVIVDTAGVRETSSLAENAGIERSILTVKEADLVLHLSSPDVPDIAAPQTYAPVWKIATKADLFRGRQSTDSGMIRVSAADGDIASLLDALTESVSQYAQAEPPLVSHLRDRHALSEASARLLEARADGKAWELVGEDLRSAAHALARLIGMVDSEHVLDRLFAGFCIGK